MCLVESPRGLQWHYELHGSGPAILFIHGWGVNLRIWRQQIKHFAASFQVIAVDLPGHGKTSWKKLSLSDIVEDIVFVMRQLGVQSAGIVGSSLGGLVALKLYHVCPEIVRFLVFVGSQPKFAKSNDYPYGLETERIRKLATQVDMHYPTMLGIFFRSLFTKEERATRRFKWIQTFRKTDFVPDKNAVIELLDVLEHEDLRDVLSEVSVPIQFINGTEDYICQRPLYEELKKILPRARFDWFEHCGHFPFLSKPYEFNHVLEDFVLQVVEV